MVTLTFDPAGVKKLVDHAYGSTSWRVGYGETAPPHPQIILVKDEGIYLMSNGLPALPGEATANFVVYAEDFNPYIYRVRLRIRHPVHGGLPYGSMVRWSSFSWKVATQPVAS